MLRPRVPLHLCPSVPLLFLLSASPTAPSRGRAPVVLTGIVIAKETRAPIRDALVTGKRSRQSARTDRFGRFAIRLTTPDTIIIRAIGRRAELLAVPSSPSEAVTIALSPNPVDLGQVVTGTDDDRPARLGMGQVAIVPLDLMRSLPAAVEPDVMRSLAVLSSVSFSSPLSARPGIRGYSADDIVTRIDGFETFNLYHLGRVFSAFPAEAAAHVAVNPGLAPPEVGSAIGGTIDIEGKTGSREPPRHGAAWSFGSLTGWTGLGGSHLQGFTAARLFYWEALNLLPNVSLPYRFTDFYSQWTIGPRGQPRGRLTVFSTQDRAQGADKYLHWSNLLVGGQLIVVRTPGADLTTSLAATRVTQKGRGIPGLHSTTESNVDNAFDRISARTDLTTGIGPVGMSLGAEVGVRRILNEIHDDALIPEPGRLPTASGRDRLVEIGLNGSLTGFVGPVGVEMAVRAQASGSRWLFDPALRAMVPFHRLRLDCAAGRVSRAYHLLSEPRSEPDFDFLDFWLRANDTIPAASVVHGFCDLATVGRSLTAKLSIYGSTGTGIGELIPGYVQHAEPGDYVRFGRSRTRGFELQLATSNRDPSWLDGSVSYAWCRSERRWGDDWQPWVLDRRHQLRGIAQARAGRSSLSVMVDVATGIPITPISYWLDPSLPGLPQGSRPGRSVDVPIYGVEQSMETRGTFRVDIGWGVDVYRRETRRFQLGVSVINVLMTETAGFGYLTENGTGAVASDRFGRPLPYRREFRLPAVPTVTARLEF